MLSILENQKGKFLIISFYYICGVWQLVDQEKIHNQCLSDDCLYSRNSKTPYKNQMTDNTKIKNSDA
jgi:hypothetical protein